MLANLRAGHWHPVAVPGNAFVQGFIADGKAGLWINATSANGKSNLALHRSAAGAWSSSTLSSGTADFLGGFSLIPGTSSVLAVGTDGTGPHEDAVLYGYGTS